MSNKGNFFRPKELTTIHQNTTQTISENTWTTLDMDVTRIDLQGYADLANNGIQIPQTVGKYWQIACVLDLAPANTVTVLLELMNGGTPFYRSQFDISPGFVSSRYLNYVVAGSASLNRITMRLLFIGDTTLDTNGVTGATEITVYRLF